MRGEARDGRATAEANNLEPFTPSLAPRMFTTESRGEPGRKQNRYRGRAHFAYPNVLFSWHTPQGDTANPAAAAGVRPVGPWVRAPLLWGKVL